MAVVCRIRFVALAVLLALSSASVASSWAVETRGGSCCGSGECPMSSAAMECCRPAPVAPDSSATPAGPVKTVAKPDGAAVALPAAPAASPGQISDLVRAAFDLARLKLPHAPPYLLNAVFRI